MYAKLELRTQPRITPQLVMAGKLLQLSGMEMEQAILDEVADNPALELVRFNDPISGTSSRWVTAWPAPQRPDPENALAVENLPTSPPAIERLIADAMLLVEREDQPLAIYLLHSLDGHGYLRQPLAKVAAETHAPLEDIERVLHLLQQLEPPGIAARNLRECLTLQCAHLVNTGADVDTCTNAKVAQRILVECWEEFVQHRWDRIGQKLGVPRPTIGQARDLMRHHLYPYPMLLLESPAPEASGYLYADLVIHKDAHSTHYQLHLPGAETFALHISAGFDAHHGYALDGAEQAWVNTYVTRARRFMAAVEQRWQTLRRIGTLLICRQQPFLEHGVAHLQPMTRGDVAAALNLHESTISRATRDKVVQLPNGRCIPLSDFFDGSLVAKAAICRLLGCSSRPLSDREIAARLELDGLAVARRTVTKYRRQLNLPSTHTRDAALDTARFAYPVRQWRSAL